MLNIHALFHQLVEETLSYSSLWPIQYRYRTGTGKHLLVVGVPWWSRSEDSTVLLQRAQVWSQIREDSETHTPPQKKIPDGYFLKYLFMVVLGLHCHVQAFPKLWWVGGYSPVAVCRFLNAMASLVCWEAQVLCTWASAVGAGALQSLGLVVVAHGLSWPSACGIPLNQGLNQCPLHCKADSSHWTTREALCWLFIC